MRDCDCPERAGFFFLLTLFAVAVLAGAPDHAHAETLCYTEFFPLEYREYKGAFTDSMDQLETKVQGDHAKGAGVVGIPISSEGSLYLASTCEYAAVIRKDLGGCVASNVISEADFTRRYDEAGRSERLIRTEEPGPKIPLSPRPCAGVQ